jgi:hypothetical protein
VDKTSDRCRCYSMTVGFVPFPGPSREHFWATLQFLGARYLVVDEPHISIGRETEYPETTLPRRPLVGPPGLWHVFQLSHPNVGNYSPTEVLTAASASEIVATLRKPDFDARTHVVLSAAIDESLVPARDMRLTPIRGGLHVLGKSSATSLVVLPQQFSNCLRPRDSRVRIVRADFLMTGLIFSGDLDTDILFDYGIFTPACRWADIADMKRLQVTIDLRMPHLSGDRLPPSWDGVVTRLRSAANAIK